MAIIKLAPILVRDALRVQENEIIEVTLVGEKKYLDILDEVTLEISSLGAFPTIRLNSPSYRTRFLKYVPEKYLRRTPPQMLRWIKDINRHITLIADEPELDTRNIPNRFWIKLNSRPSRESTCLPLNWPNTTRSR